MQTLPAWLPADDRKKSRSPRFSRLFGAIFRRAGDIQVRDDEPVSPDKSPRGKEAETK